MAMLMTKSRNWWNKKKGSVYETVIPYVRTVENQQAETFDKFVKLEATYDVNSRTNRQVAENSRVARLGRARAVVTENLIASQVDTVAAHVADTDVAVRIHTDDADWKHQQTAERLEMYLNGLSKLFDVGDKCRTGFKAGAAMKGTGLNKVYIDQFDQIQVIPVPIDNIIVDERECRNGKPRHLHYRDFYDREDLQAQFPEHAEAIDKAQTTGNWRVWAGYRPIESNEIVVIESWRLPIGPKGHERYVPGRHTLTIDGCDLLDEEYDDAFYPFAKMVWNAPISGFYGISLSERILPHQNLLNRRGYQINRSLDKKADPITYVHQADQGLATKTVNEVGSIAVYKHTLPVTVDHKAVSAEVFQDIPRIKQSAADQTGINQGMQSGGVPAGIESGVGVREVRTTRTQTFSIQEKGFETFWLDTLYLVLQMCKKLGGTKAPEILHVAKYGNERIKWSEVDMDDIRIQMSAASDLGNTEAGRQQRITELMQAGVVTLEEGRELMEHTDIKSVMSLYNAAWEDAKATVDMIVRGKDIVVPEPAQNLKMLVWHSQQKYLQIRHIRSVPEEILEALSDFNAMAANMLNPPPPPQLGAPPPGAPMPPMGGGAPSSAFASGAFAPMAA
jgi:hypothetical protein